VVVRGKNPGSNHSLWGRKEGRNPWPGRQLETSVCLLLQMGRDKTLERKRKRKEGQEKGNPWHLQVSAKKKKSGSDKRICINPASEAEGTKPGKMSIKETGGKEFGVFLTGHFGDRKKRKRLFQSPARARRSKGEKDQVFLAGRRVSRRGNIELKDPNKARKQRKDV